MDYVGEEQVRNEAARRWPSNDQEQKYFELNMLKKQRGRANPKRIKPREVTFPLLHEVNPAMLKKILLAASIKLKSVKRDPGFVLIRQYNLGNRPLEFI